MCVCVLRIGQAGRDIIGIAETGSGMLNSYFINPNHFSNLSTCSFLVRR
jgi:hypothetical protein